MSIFDIPPKSSKFVKLESEFHEYTLKDSGKRRVAHWVTQKPTDCTESPSCKLCAAGDKPVVKYEFITLVDADEEDRTLSISEAAARTWSDAASKAGGPEKFTATLWKARRTGTGRDTTYEFLAMGPVGDAPPF